MNRRIAISALALLLSAPLALAEQPPLLPKASQGRTAEDTTQGDHCVPHGKTPGRQTVHGSGSDCTPGSRTDGQGRPADTQSPATSGRDPRSRENHREGTSGTDTGAAVSTQ